MPTSLPSSQRRVTRLSVNNDGGHFDRAICFNMFPGDGLAEQTPARSG
jgi:hypothetical protein